MYNLNKIISNMIMLTVGLSKSIGSKIWLGSLPHQLQADLIPVSFTSI